MQYVLTAVFVFITLGGELQAQEIPDEHKVKVELGSSGVPTPFQTQPRESYTPGNMYDLYGRPIGANQLSPHGMSRAIASFYSQHRGGPFSLDLSKLKRIDKAPPRTGNEDVYKLRDPKISCGFDYEICHYPITNSFTVTVSGGIAGIRHVYVPRSQHMSGAISGFVSQHRDGPFSLDLSKLKKIDKAPPRVGNEEVYKLVDPTSGTEYEIFRNPNTNSFTVIVREGVTGIRHVYVPRLQRQGDVEPKNEGKEQLQPKTESESKSKKKELPLKQ